MPLDFNMVAVGRLFHMNGNDYIKQSSRTAKMLCNGKTFYIGKLEQVTLFSY